MSTLHDAVSALYGDRTPHAQRAAAQDWAEAFQESDESWRECIDTLTTVDEATQPTIIQFVVTVR